MREQGGWGRERRENLAELDPLLRNRLLGLDEPVDRGDWAAVVGRSRGLRLSRYCAFTVVASGAAVLSLALASALAPQFRGGGHPAPGAAPLRLTLHLSDGSGLVLYSNGRRTRFLDNADGRLAGRYAERTTASGSRTAEIARSLSGGPFPVRAALIRDAGGARQVSHGPLPGDEALVSLRVFTTPELRGTVGSAILTCQYGFERNAYCDGAVDLEDGVRLTAAGTLNTDADHVTLAVTSGYGRDGISRAS